MTMMHTRKNRSRRWRHGVLLLWLLALTSCGEQRFEAVEARDFTLPSLTDGNTVSLHEFHGSVVYLTFWASWCVPCRQEMPYLTQLWQRHHASGLQVIGINVEEDAALARQFAAELDLPFPLAWDQNRAVSELYRVPGFPTHFIVDRRGRIRFSGLGFNLADVEAVSQEVETLLRESAGVTE